MPESVEVCAQIGMWTMMLMPWVIMTKELAKACQYNVFENSKDRHADDDGDAMRKHDEIAPQRVPN